MTREEIFEMDEVEQAIVYLVLRLKIYNLYMDKVILENRHTKKGKLITRFTVYTHSRSGKVHTERIFMKRGDYIWFLTTLANLFPYISVEDKRKYKIGEGVIE